MAIDGAPLTRGYRFDQLLDGGGSALVTDATVPSASHLPPEKAVATLPQQRPLTLGDAFIFHALDGTTVTVSVWVLEEGSSAWLLFKSGVVVAAASNPVVASVAGFAVPPGARVFLQVTANTGVTKLGWRWC